MASKTEWANRALVKIGENRITSLDDNTKPARTINSMFDRVRDAELRKHRWSFSIKRANLAADSEAPEFGYGVAYTLPTDCLRIVTINGGGVGADLSDVRWGAPAYAVEGRKILLDGATSDVLTLRYIAAIDDTTLWDALFGEAFSSKLAVEACETLTGSSDKRRMAWEEYRDAVAAARRANAIELPSHAIDDDTWITARSL